MSRSHGSITIHSKRKQDHAENKMSHLSQNIKLILFIAFSNYMWFTEFSLNCDEYKCFVFRFGGS